MFSLRFFLWFGSSKKSLVMLLYGMAFAVLSFSELMVAVSDTYLLSQKDLLITSDSEVRFYDFEEGTFLANFYDYYNYIDIGSFVLMLSATSILLYHYSIHLRRVKLAVLIGLPLLSYLSGYLDALNIYDTDTNPDLFSYYIFQAISTTSAGILFGVSLWFIVRRMEDVPARNFIIMAAYGFVLFYITNSASVTVSPYPPFGMPSLSFLPLATCLILVGIYSCAVSLSQNLELRKSLRKITQEDRNLLLNISTAQMDIEVRKLVEGVRYKIDQEESNMAEETGIQTTFPTEEMQKYLSQVLSEIRKIDEDK